MIVRRKGGNWPCVLLEETRGFNAFGMMMKKCDDMMKVKNEKSIDQQHM